MHQKTELTIIVQIFSYTVWPSIVPCGTPVCTGIEGDTMFLILTAWRRSQRKLQIHWIMKPRTPRWMSLLTKIVWSIWSKALLKSRKQALRNIEYNTIQTLLTLPKEGFSVTII